MARRARGAGAKPPRSSAKPSKACLGAALRALTEARGREGARIAEMLAKRNAGITALIAGIQPQLDGVQVRYRERLRERLQRLDVQADPERLEQELALIAQRADVAEEIDRIASHVDGSPSDPAAQRARRAAARLPDSGAEPRSEHVRLEGAGRGPDARGRRAQGAHRADARAGAEPRMTAARATGVTRNSDEQATLENSRRRTACEPPAERGEMGHRAVRRRHRGARLELAAAVRRRASRRRAASGRRPRSCRRSRSRAARRSRRRPEWSGSRAGNSRWARRSRCRYDLVGMQAMADSRPVHRVLVDGFWMDETEVTNEQFARFVAATGYVTVAERAPRAEDFPGVPPEALVAGSAVFSAPAGPVSLSNALAMVVVRAGCQLAPPARPRQLDRKQRPRAGRACRVRGCARLRGVGREALADGSRVGICGARRPDGKDLPWGDEFTHGSQWMGNTHQGHFPDHDTGADSFVGVGPVAQFPPNDYGLYDVGGNVWEWVSDWYRPDYYAELAAAGTAARNPQGPSSSHDPEEPGVPKRVHRGGSFLCTDQYCARYMVGTRGKGDVGTSTNHLGFRTVLQTRVSMTATRTGQLWVIAAPSGAGKTSLVRALLERDPIAEVLDLLYDAQAAQLGGRRPGLLLRQPRRSSARWRARTRSSSTRKSSTIGTARDASTSRPCSAAGFTVVLEIDWQGAQQVRERAPGVAQRLHSPAERRRARAPAARAQDGFRGRHRSAGSRTRAAT